MRLRDLDASFRRVTEYFPDGDVRCHEEVPTLEGAHGLMFQCPLCAQGKEQGEEDGRRFVRGSHYVICWFRNPRGGDPVGPNAKPGPGRWWAVGSSLDDLTFDFGTPPVAKSVQLQGGCNWHGFVTDGEAR